MLREHYLGPCHARTAHTLYDLALFYHRQGNLGQAIALAERALQIRLQTLGNMHPKTVAARAYHTNLLQAQENAEKQTVH